MTQSTSQTLILRFYHEITRLRDPYENHHSTHTAEWTIFLAEAISLDNTDITLLKVAAHLHDMGKLGIAENIVNKNGHLTEAEFGMIQLHPKFGARLARALQLGPLIEDVILHHHENFDGTGYPKKLIGAQTSIHARIVRLADSYDALTSKRPYRAAYSAREAIAILENESHKFDPDLLALLRRKVTNWTSTLSR